MKNKKSPLIAIAIIVMLMALVVIGHAASEKTCDHKNVTITETVILEGDCYHHPEKEITKTCNDCGFVTVMREVSSEDVHGEIEVIDESTPATCAECGWFRVRRVCKRCGQTVGGATQPIMAFSHPVNTNGTVDCYETRVREVGGNCDSYGFREIVTYCKECNCKVAVTREQLPMSEHFWSDWTVSENGTTRTRHCLFCDKEEVQTDIFAVQDEKMNVEEYFKTIAKFFEQVVEMLKLYFDVQ